MNEITNKMDLIEPTPQYYLFKRYCGAMLEFLKEVTYLERFSREDNVKIFFSTPSRCWSKYVSPLVNGLPSAPIISFYLNNAEPKQGEIMGGRWVHQIFKHPTKENTFQLSYAPSIWRLSFNVTIWTQTLNDMDNLISQLLLYTMPPSIWAGKFDDLVWYEIGNEGGIRIEDELEPGETKDKVIRRGLTFYVPRAYFPREMIENVPSINSIQAEIEHYDGIEVNTKNNEILRSIEIN